MKENIFPELSGMELHYSSSGVLNISKPFGIFDDSTSGPTTGGSDPFVAPRAAESLGASGGKPINGMFDELGAFEKSAIAFGKMQIDFEKHLMFGKHEVSIGVDPYDGFKRPYDYAPPSEREIALKFLEDIKKMPHCILVDVLIDPDEMYAVDIHEILWARGVSLTHAQQEFVVEKIKEHCIAKLSVPY
jgi:hypothetical protein